MASRNKQPFKSISHLTEVSEETVYHFRLLKLIDSSHPDVFYTDAEDKVIQCGHHCIIKARYPQLLEGSIKKRRGHYINLAKTKKAISGHSAAFEKVMGYVYSGIVDWGNHSIDSAVEIVHIAKAYGMVHLLEVNKKFIFDNISIENVFQVLSYSNGLGLEEVKKICINFAMNNATLFFSAKEAKSLDFDLYQELVGILADLYSVGKAYQFEEPSINETDPIRKHFKSMYNSRDESGDISIVLGDKTTKAHKCILYGHSKILDELIDAADQPTQNYTITVEKQKFPMVNQEAFEEIMKFFYYDFTGLELSSVCRMYKFSMDIHLTRLTRILEHVMTSSVLTAKAVPFALEVSLKQLQHNQSLSKKLHEKTIIFAIKHFPDINFSILIEMDSIIGVTMIQSIQEILREYIRSGQEPHYPDIINKAPIISLNESSSPPPRPGSKSPKKVRRKSLKN